MKDLEELVGLCHTCLESTNYQEKQNTEHLLSVFVRQLAPKDLPSLFSSIDDSSIFVIISFLVSNLSNLQNHLQWLIQTVQMYSKWYTSDQNFVINQNFASYHLTGKLKQWLGELMKTSYYRVLYEGAKKQEMFTYFKNLRQQLRVLSYLSFIDTFSVINHDIGFIAVRNNMYSFQHDWIPIMFDEVRDILKKMYDEQEISSVVTSMQSSLNIIPRSPATASNNVQFTWKKAEKMILLFKQLTDFKYNLDQTQYDQGVEYDDLIHYPKGIKINTKTEIFQYSSRLSVDLVTSFPENNFTEIFLQCFIKIISMRQPSSEHIQNLLQSSIYMMQQQNTTQTIKYLLVDFNNRIIKIIPSFSDFYINNVEIIHQWMRRLLQLVGWVFGNTAIEFKNINLEYIARMFNVMFRVSGKNSLIDHQHYFIQLSHQVFKMWANYLFNRNQCLLSQNVKDSQQMIVKTQDQFRKWIPTLFLNDQNIPLLKIVQSQIFSNLNNINNVINFNLLVGYLVNQYQHCFQQNIHYRTISKQAIGFFGNIVVDCYTFFTSEASLGIESLSYHLSTLYFFKELVLAIIGSKESQQGNINNQFFQLFLPQQVAEAQNMIIKCITEICRRISIQNSTLIQFSFEILFNISQSLTLNHSNEMFVRQVHNQLLKTYINIASTSLKSSQTCKCRESLFRNITSIIQSFDYHSIKQYLLNLINVISNVEYEQQSVKLLSQIYDIKGLTKGIRKAQHFPQFVQLLSPILASLNQTVFTRGTDHLIVKEVLSIYNQIFKACFCFACLQLTRDRIYNIVLPYWAEILNNFIQPQEISQKDLQTVLVVIQGFINCFQDKNNSPYNARDFLGLFSFILRSILKSSNTLQISLDDSKTVVYLYKLICNTLLQSAFDLFQGQEIQIFFHFHQFMFTLLLKYNKLLSQNNNDRESQIHQLSSILHQSSIKLYQFILKRYLLVSNMFQYLKPNKIQKSVELFISNNKGSINQILVQLFQMLILTANKTQQQQIFTHTSCQIRHLIQTFPQSQQYILTNFITQGCNPQMQIKLMLVYQNTSIKQYINNLDQEQENQDLSDEHFKSFLKDWVKSIEVKPPSMIDDY